jgi:hypothetical protein
MDRWMAGTIQFGSPTPLANQSADMDDERDPWVSQDGLQLYYAFRKSGQDSDIYLATRKDVSSSFGAGVKQVNVSTAQDDDRPSLTADEQTFVMATTRGSATAMIEMAMRGDTTAMFPSTNTMHMGNVNQPTLGSNHYDPFLSTDGLRLYYAPTTPGLQHIAMASRSDASSDFSAGQLLANITSTNADEADPALSLDERILVFSSDRSGGTGKNDLWYATRSDKSQDFSAPHVIPNVNSSDEDGDPMLSADGCTLYFATTHNSHSYDLYSATMTH